jgi:integrase/recombinase XerD
MKKKIFLKRIFHRNEWRYAIVFKYDDELTRLAKSVKNVAWSQSNACWYAGADESTLKQMLTLFRESADIDISAIVSANPVKAQPVTEIPVPESEEANIEPTPFPEEISKDISVKKKHQDSFKKTAKLPEFDPVIFSISETDGSLVIKFTGKHEREWIRELNSYGRVFYEGTRKEWRLKWSQLAVDSLSDYFAVRGVEVIVKKGIVPVELKEMREEKGGEVRSRVLGIEARNKVDLLRRYLEDKRYSKRTCEAYLANLELFFKYYHEKDPDDINTEDIREFIDTYVLRLGYSASYQNIIISAIKIYYYIAGTRRVAPDSLSRPRRGRALPKVFSKEEVMKIFDATRNGKHKLMLWLIYSTGLRRSEVTNIKLTDLDPERGILNIREGKGGVDRMVPIPAKVWEKINSYIKSFNPTIYLFEGQTGGKYSVESVYSVFKQSMKRAGINKDVGVHSLRHSYATHLHESGLDIRYIQELLGHKSTRTTEIYTHVSRRNLFAIRSPIEDMDIG